MTDLGDRHAGDAGGRLLTDASPVTVGVIVEPDFAGTAATQHTAWMLLNLLARLEGTVKSVSLECPGAQLAGRVSPLGASSTTLKETLLGGAEGIGGVPVRDEPARAADLLLTVGPGAAPTTGWRVFGDGFCGAISTGAIDPRTAGPLPFGPYVAACLGAAEVFRSVRLPASRYRLTEALSFSLFDYEMGAGTLRPGPVLPDHVGLDFGLAGVGAVGCATLQTLWACPGLGGSAVIADADAKGVDLTNLNRCVIFDRRHLGEAKASSAGLILADCDIRWESVDGLYARENLPRIPPTLLSAVDTNRSRISIQEGFWPGRLFGASTLDLRAEVDRFGPPGVGPCLSCFNPPEPEVPDDVRRADLRKGGEEAIAALARRIGCSPEAVRAWAEKGECGEVGAAVLADLRDGDASAPFFSVGFVSVFAGVALAAELVKESAGYSSPLDDGAGQAKLQFLNPSADGNGVPRAARRDQTCTHCDEGSVGLDVWGGRAAAWTSPRRGDR